MKNKLKYYGLSGHGNINTDTQSERTVSRRVLCIKRVVNSLDACVNDVINLRERYVINQFRNNKEVFHVIKPRIEKIWIREQNLLIRNDRQMEEFGIQVTLTGVLSHWTQTQWNDFNRSVCIIYCYVCIRKYICIFL